MSCDRICTSSVSVVAFNGNIIPVGASTLSLYDATRFGARAERACSSHVKVVLRHVLGRADWHASVLGCKLVTTHVARQDLYPQGICCTDKR